MLTINVDTANVGSNYVDKDFPYASSFAGLYMFGASEALSCLNRAPGATVNMTPTGTATYGTGYVELTHATSYFSSGINISQDHTIIVVADFSTLGEWYASADIDFTLGMAGAASRQVRYSSAFGPAAVGAADTGALYGFIAAGSAGTTGQPFNVYVGKADALTKTSSGSLGSNLVSKQVLIGPSGTFGTAGGSHRQAMAAICDTELTQAQILEIYQYVRFKMPKRGIAVA